MTGRRRAASLGKIEEGTGPARPRATDGAPPDTPEQAHASPPPESSRLRRAGPGVWTACVVLPASVSLWLMSLRDVRLDAMGDLGLLQALPVLFWIALGLLVLGFCVAAAARRTAHSCFALYVLTLIAMIHATPPMVEQELRYSWAWKHVAVVDAMLRHDGEVPNAGGFDIYNQWPGFFQFNALILRATGLESPLGYAMWAQVLANVLMLGPLLVIYRSITTDRRLVWGAVWIYYSCSWVGQDYFAPQAFTFLLCACVIALVVRQLPSSRLPRPGPAGGGWPRGRFVLVIVIEAAIASSHQLTPLMLISALLLLSLPRRNRRVALPALAGAVVLTAAWNATVARRYVSANLDSFVDALTRPEANIWSGLSRLGDAAPSQVMVSWIDRGLSGGVFLLAALALMTRRWTRRTPLLPLVLFPLPLALVNAYGGEMIFRAYMFALPAAAFLIAALLMPQGRRLPARMPVVAVLLAAMLGSLLFGYYSKEAMNRFSAQEVAATRYVTTQTPPGSVIISVTFAAPGLEMHYDRHERAEITQEGLQAKRLLAKDPLTGLEPLLRRAGDKPAYVILNRAQYADVHLNGEMPPGFMSRLETDLARSPDFTPVHRSDDAVVYRFAPPSEGSRG
ncbi:glycosyltransferase [Streptomyces hawaiiensis]|uniref:glycosyltransferase n=1 Tax=Streptomyces hawaiiensis TaxID=67305 RepID=UPI003665A73F